MKKLSKLFMLVFLGLTIGLGSCGGSSGESLPDGSESQSNTSESQPNTSESDPSQVETSVTSYLVLGEGGLYNGEPGETISNLYLENTVRFEAEPGTKLPDSTAITHSNGLYFHRWVRIDGHGHETRVNVVPESDNNVYYAVFGTEQAGVEMRVYLKAPEGWTKANIYIWTKTGSAMQAWPGVAMSKDTTLGLWYYDYDTTLYPNVIFNNGSEQSEDLTSPKSDSADCYVWSNGWYNEDTTELPYGGGEPPKPGETMRVYLNAPTWTDAYIYMWTNTLVEHTQWPGTSMIKDTSTGLWYYDYDTTYYSNVIFNNGNAQTADLKSPTSDTADCYHLEYRIWYNDTDVPEEPEPTDGTLYFVPELWNSDGAWFAIWCWGAGDQWVDLTKINDNLYSYELPVGTSGFLFVRLDPKYNAPSWDGKWNQTGDLTPPTNGNNCYTMTSMDAGVWSVYNG